MFNVERIKEIVTGPIEPNVPNTLWIDTTNPESPVLKVVVNGAYRAMAGSSSSGGDSDKCHCDIVTVELGVGDYIPATDNSLPVFSEELNSEVWGYLEDGKCVLIKENTDEGSGITVSSYFLLEEVQKTSSTSTWNIFDFDVYDITVKERDFVHCCAPENYQTLKDYREVDPA